MKAIMKKVAQLKGVTLNIHDVAGYMEAVECYIEQDCFIITNEHQITVKVKGKVIDNRDLTISFEET